jgi:hypothetical protein
MDPLTPNDPLWKLLGKSRRIEARPNFTQNVLRAARQTPQERGWFARLRTWATFPERPGLAWAVAAAVALAAGLVLMQPTGSAPEVAQQPAEVPALLLETDFPLVDGYDTQWQNLEQMGDLLAVQDSALLTDREIHLLLY